MTTDLAGLELKELETFVQSLGHKKFHAKQIYQWIWKRGVSDFNEMTNLSRELRASLAASATVSLPDVVTLGQHFKNHGYFVQGMGKIYHGGFDDPATWSVPWQTPKAQTYGRPENNQYGRPATDPDDARQSPPRVINQAAGRRAPSRRSSTPPRRRS